MTPPETEGLAAATASGTVGGMANTRSMSVPEPLDHAVAWTPTLFDAEPVRADPVFAGIRRVELSDGAWVDHSTGWLHGAAAVFDDLVANVAWRHGRRLMYGQFVDEPRLHAWSREAVADCHVARPVIDRMANLLSRRYGVMLSSVGLNYYRDGEDSVAWHGDRIHRERHESTIAIVSVGGHRPLPAPAPRGRHHHRAARRRRRPARHGRHLPAHLVPLGPQGPRGAAPHQHHLPRPHRRLSLVRNSLVASAAVRETPTMQIRPATDADIDHVATWRLAFLADHRGVEPSDLGDAFAAATRAFVAEHHRTGALRSWLADDDDEGATVGVVSLLVRPVPPRPECPRHHRGLRAQPLRRARPPAPGRRPAAPRRLPRPRRAPTSGAFRRLVLHATEDGRPMYERAPGSSAATAGTSST